eukprot:m.502707 g.502707  ORF g.502707 m.502707 type:complete len:526 (+) comp21843_c0_seq16:1426-3003(+)
MFESGRICVCTAYTTNYMPGFLCEDVNKSYAVRHGYDFVSRCLSPLAMMTNIFPRGHGTWYKVRLLNELLVLKEGSSTRKKYDVIVWIDGDACVVKPERRIEQYFAKASDTTDLIVGEDMTPACLVNAGVLLIRNTDWSQRLWQDVWQSEQFTKWHDKCFHEQSALCKWLKTHEEGFGSVVPWFSYKGGPKERNTKHVCVLPHHDLNTNGGSLEFQKCRSMSKQAREESLTAAVSGGPQFIFHAVGCSNKLDALVSKIRQAGLELPIDTSLLTSMLYPRVGNCNKPIKDSGALSLAKVYEAWAAEDSTGGLQFKYCSLEGNELTPASLPALCTMLQTRMHRHQLETVMLGGNLLGDAGALAVSRLLRGAADAAPPSAGGNTTDSSPSTSMLPMVAEVGFAHNRITAVGAKALLAAAAVNTNVQWVDISGHKFADSEDVLQAITSLFHTRGLLRAKSAAILRDSIRTHRREIVTRLQVRSAHSAPTNDEHYVASTSALAARVAEDTPPATAPQTLCSARNRIVVLL